MPDDLRAIAYVDGFNLYHAVHELGLPHLKWVDLGKVCGRFLPENYSLIRVTYCSAYYQYDQEKVARHRAFVEAQPAIVKPCIGRFREKKRRCKIDRCGGYYTSHEEKETDVNIALQIIRDAYKGEHQCAIVISADSDLVPVIRLMREDFPKIAVRLVYPMRRQSWHLLQAANLHHPEKLTVAHLEASLLPEVVERHDGVMIRRPAAYAPPL